MASDMQRPVRGDFPDGGRGNKQFQAALDAYNAAIASQSATENTRGQAEAAKANAEAERINSMGPNYKGPPMLYPNNQAIASRILGEAKPNQSEQGGAPVLKPRDPRMSDQELLAQAQEAIKNGKDPAAVKAQLEAYGVKMPVAVPTRNAAPAPDYSSPAIP